MTTNIYDVLDNLGIQYTKHEHRAVFTVEESRALDPIPGVHTKNLFLRNKNKSVYYLVSIEHTKQADLKKLAGILGESRLSFGSPEKLKEYLGVKPGSVTLLGLINDTDHKVQVIIDQELWEEDTICCHPLVNTATLQLPREGLEKFFERTGHKPRYIEL